MDPEEAVKESMRLLGIEYLKEKQQEAVMSFLDGKDTFVSLPTGYGKSLIYALLPFAFDRIRGKIIDCLNTQLAYTARTYVLGDLLLLFLNFSAVTTSIVVCISPLTSSMVDQKAKFTPRGLRTEYVTESQINTEGEDDILKGEVQLVYISPESLLYNWKFRKMLTSAVYKENLVALIIDEAHCVKTWGESFKLLLLK